MSDHIICSVFCPVDVILGFSFKFGIIQFIYHMNLCLLCLKVLHRFVYRVQVGFLHSCKFVRIVYLSEIYIRRWIFSRNFICHCCKVFGGRCVCLRVTIIDANIDNNVFWNFLIFILGFQHASEILKMSSRVALDLDIFQWTWCDAIYIGATNDYCVLSNNGPLPWAFVPWVLFVVTMARNELEYVLRGTPLFWRFLGWAESEISGMSGEEDSFLRFSGVQDWLRL